MRSEIKKEVRIKSLLLHANSSKFLPLTSYFLLLTSYLTSNAPLPTTKPSEINSTSYLPGL